MAIIGTVINKFRLVRLVNQGQVGTVYYAERIDGIEEVRAIKLIPKENIRDSWAHEIQKVVKLGHSYPVPIYFDHDTITIAGKEYLWISYEWIEGTTIKKLIEEKKITVSILLSVIKSVLEVLHGCKMVGIQHGDLHAGNIMVIPPNSLSIEKSYKAYVIDFGYLSASMGTHMMYDYSGLSRIITDSVATFNNDFHLGGGDEKKYISILKNIYLKYLLETDPTMGDYVRNPLKLLALLHELKDTFGQGDSPSASSKNISDCLAAELMGERFDEWRELFVPDFLASSEVLSNNISVITGLRGCGKTTIFRRLSALFNCHLGYIDLPNAKNFTGCYQNARNLAEAFPWLPNEKISVARNQIIKYFHIGWCLDIVSWLTAENTINSRNLLFEWLYEFFSLKFGQSIEYANPKSLSELRDFLTAQLLQSKLYDEYLPEKNKELSDIEFLDNLVEIIQKNCLWTRNKPFFFFFDDYSTPLISEAFQQILNPIIFRRSPNVIFKVATESVESFLPIGLHSKRLEENDDYVLIDFGNVHLQNTLSDNAKIISAILNKRIARDSRFAAQLVNLETILGDSPDFNSFASNLRPQSKKKAFYCGHDFFCSMWSCDIREIIRLFASMVDSLDFEREMNWPISPQIQDNAMRSAGGKYVALLNAATNPVLNTYEITDKDTSYGEQLAKIAEGFHRVAIYELLRDARNQKNVAPKQARKIEMTEPIVGETPKAEEFYKGLIRYGLFIRDVRGKSAGGKAVPRLVLRGLLIPYYTLSFSKHDSVTMNNKDFNKLLLSPQNFEDYWKKGHPLKGQSSSPNQLELDLK